MNVIPLPLGERGRVRGSFRVKLTLGSIPFLWDKEKIRTFYKEIADTPVSVVYIGEVVCSKRTVLGMDALLEIGRMLEEAGKEVVITTLGLITNREELEFMKLLCRLPFAVEVNNTGVLNLCSGENVLTGGPHLAVYNTPGAGFFAGIGIKRLVFMPELNRQAIESISLATPSVEKEVIAFGHLSVALSWRCYTARAHALSKTNCAIICKKYPGGMPLETMDGMPIFNANGTQLLSGQRICMIEQLDILKSLGIEYLRIIPQELDTLNVIEIFNKTLEGVIEPHRAIEALRRYAPEGIGNGWFYGEPGWRYVDKESAEVGAVRPSQPHIQDNR